MHYTDSQGVAHAIDEMPYPFLVNARRKLQQRQGAHPSELVDAMLAEEAKRNLDYVAKVPTLETTELIRALTKNMTPQRRTEADWTPERQAVFEAVTAELQRRSVAP